MVVAVRHFWPAVVQTGLDAIELIATADPRVDELGKRVKAPCCASETFRLNVTSVTSLKW